MQCIVVYDIPDDKARTRIADVCLDYGLDRIQLSAFLGDLARTHQEELLGQIKKALGKKAGNVQIFPICEKDWRLRLVIAQQSCAQRGSALKGEAGAEKAAGEGEAKKVARSRSTASQRPAREILWMPEPEQEEELPPL